MPEDYETYHININGAERDLRLFEVAPGVRIAVVNILGDTELVQAASKGLAEKLASIDFDTIVTAEAKSIPLAYALSIDTGRPYVVLRKSYKSYMGDALKSETVSITTGTPQTLYLDEKDCKIVSGKNVIIVDDVISTGSTLEGIQNIMKDARANVTAEVAILTEGDLQKWEKVVSLGHLPIWLDE
jgi:adenine phosphoribosyltransferase